jgi:hypothetical protein
MGYTQLTAEHRKARKTHRCVWCGEAIPKGTVYDYYSGVFDGDMQSSRYHFECVSASREWCQENDPWGDGYMPYEFFRGVPVCRDDKDALAAYLFGDWPTTTQETAHAAD